MHSKDRPVVPSNTESGGNNSSLEIPNDGGKTQGPSLLPPAMTLSESDHEELSLRSHDEYIEVASDNDGDCDFLGAADVFGCPPPPPDGGPNNLFRTSYAGRPVGLQGPAHKAGELGLQWLSVMKSLEIATAKETDGWSDKIQLQKYDLEEIHQHVRQSNIEKETEKTKMQRADHRHALQQLVVEAFRWRRAATQQQLCLDISRTTTVPSHSESLTSPRTMKTVASVDLESLCGLTIEEDEDLAFSTSNPSSSLNPAEVAPSVTPRSIISSCASSTSSTISACNRQAWKRQFPLPHCVPPRDKADHTTNPLDVADRAMLYGVLDDIDSVMTTSDLGDDGLPKDRYSEVLANLQFLGLFRPKYADDEEDEERSMVDSIDDGIVDDLNEDDLFCDHHGEQDAYNGGLVEIIDA